MNLGYLRFVVYQIHFLRSFLRRPHTDRFPDDVLKKLRWNRNCDSYEKNATGAEKTGIQRIPAGIGNLAALAIALFIACHPHCCCYCPSCPQRCPLYCSPATLVAITIALATLAIPLFIAHHLIAVAIANVIPV